MKGSRYNMNPVLNRLEEERFQRLMWKRVSKASSSIDTGRAKAPRKQRALQQPSDTIVREVQHLEEILKAELGAVGPGDIAQTIQKKLDRVKQMACISKQVCLTGSTGGQATAEASMRKRFSRALRSTCQPDKSVDNTRAFYHAHPQQTTFYPSKPSHEHNSRGRKAGWDTSFAQAPSADYVRNVRNCKILQQPSISTPRSKSRSHVQQHKSSHQPVKQLGSGGRGGQEACDDHVPFQDDGRVLAATPSAAAMLRQLKEVQRSQHAAQEGNAMRGPSAALCSNSKKHSAVCESHTLGSHAAKERVKNTHRKSDGRTKQAAQQPGAALEASKVEQGIEAASKSAGGVRAKQPQVVAPTTWNRHPPRLQRVKHLANKPVPPAFESSLRLIVDSGEPDPVACLYRANEPAQQLKHARPRTPRLTAVDKPRLKTASCASDPSHSHTGVLSATGAGQNALTTSVAEATKVPAGVVARQLDGMLAVNMLDRPFCFDAKADAPHACPLATRTMGDSSSQLASDQASSPQDSGRTRSTSSSKSQDLNSSFRQRMFMACRAHAARQNVAGEPVDSSSMSHERTKSGESEQSRALVAAQQLLAGVHQAEICKSVQSHRVASDVRTERAMVDRVKEAANDRPLRLVGDHSDYLLELSGQVQLPDKAVELVEGSPSVGGPPDEDAIGIALMAAAVASAAGEALHLDADPVPGHRVEAESCPVTSQHVSDDVLHTFVADRLSVDETEISQALLQSEARSHALDVQQHQVIGADNAAAEVDSCGDDPAYSSYGSCLSASTSNKTSAAGGTTCQENAKAVIDSASDGAKGMAVDDAEHECDNPGEAMHTSQNPYRHATAALQRVWQRGIEQLQAQDITIAPPCLDQLPTADGAQGCSWPAIGDDDCECLGELPSVGQPIEDDEVWPDARDETWILQGDDADCLQPGMHGSLSLQEQEALLQSELHAHEQMAQLHMMETYMHSLGMACHEPQLVWCPSTGRVVDPQQMACHEGQQYVGQNEIPPLQPGVAQRMGCTEIELME